ncbi:hypothetical protein D3C72_1303430 [compost metagenome]
MRLYHAHLQRRMRQAQRADRRGQQCQGGGRQRPQRDIAAPHRSQIGKAAVGLFQIGDGALHTRMEVLPGAGQADVARGALEQAQPQHFFQVLDQRGE